MKQQELSSLIQPFFRSVRWWQQRQWKWNTVYVFYCFILFFLFLHEKCTNQKNTNLNQHVSNTFCKSWKWTDGDLKLFIPNMPDAPNVLSINSSWFAGTLTISVPVRWFESVHVLWVLSVLSVNKSFIITEDRIITDMFNLMEINPREQLEYTPSTTTSLRKSARPLYVYSVMFVKGFFFLKYQYLTHTNVRSKVNLLSWWRWCSNHIWRQR